jgi:hypothetical protein
VSLARRGWFRVAVRLCAAYSCAPVCWGAITAGIRLRVPGPLASHCALPMPIARCAAQVLKNLVDAGDFVGARGGLRRTDKGELSVVVDTVEARTRLVSSIVACAAGYIKASVTSITDASELAQKVLR